MVLLIIQVLYRIYLPLFIAPTQGALDYFGGASNHHKLSTPLLERPMFI
jgi:hypothetical protein